MRKKKIDSKFIFILLILLFISFILYFGFAKKSCKEQSCFDEALGSCSPAKFNKVKNNNLYSYSISRSFGKDCIISVKMEKMSPGTELDLVELLEGKSMVCKIPKSELKIVNLDEMDNLLSYCSGELKEGLYELMLKRMYGLVVKHIGSVIGEMRGLLKGV